MRTFEQALPRQVDVIKKAYLQEEERENSEVSPREVGHNIYILALQVPAPLNPPRPCPAHPVPATAPSAARPHPRRPRPAHPSLRPQLGDGLCLCSALQAQQTAAAPAEAREAHPGGGGRGHLFHGGVPPPPQGWRGGRVGGHLQG